MPDLTTDPGYWRYETSGVLKPAIEAYLSGQPMTQGQIVAMRAYLRQWIAAPGWQGEAVESLRGCIDMLISRPTIEAWLDYAMKAGIDPL
mgnify:CR=1 FL=1